MGDATNTVLILAGELLKRAENLLVMGLHPSEVIKGYELACTKALAELESTSCPHFNDSSSLRGAPSTSVID
jgi:T-complex protein 1 subunit theta